MATNTYVALDKVTVSGSSTLAIQLNSIPATYTDLRVVINGGAEVLVDGFPYCYINGDNSSSLYSGTAMIGNGTTAFSERNTGYTKCGNFSVSFTNSYSGLYEIDFLSYSNSSTFKTALWRMNCPSSGYAGTGAATTLWRNTNAISSLEWRLTNGGVDRVWKDGTTVTLYGIRAEGVTPAPKATGGAIYSDSTYYYHAFGATGTFTPLQSLTCDYVVVAGGGGSGYGTGGGGGAGGFRSFTSQSLTATGYAVTVGAGGAGSTSANSAGSDGSTSSFNSINTTGGGGGGSQPGSGAGSNGRAGGSGGGAARSGSAYYGGSGNAGSYTPVEGFGGGNNTTAASNGCGGGGGAGGAGASGTTTADGAGGIGATSALVTAIVSATGVGQLVSGTGYIAGGGGGGGAASGTKSGAAGGYGGGAQGGAELSVGNNGIENTGGGAGGAGLGNGGRGGSGVVIIRYTKA